MPFVTGDLMVLNMPSGRRALGSHDKTRLAAGLSSRFRWRRGRIELPVQRAVVAYLLRA